MITRDNFFGHKTSQKTEKFYFISDVFGSILMTDRSMNGMPRQTGGGEWMENVMIGAFVARCETGLFSGSVNRLDVLELDHLVTAQAITAPGRI
ncbi:hypothetical protein [Paracoccus onubensis]|uniref:Uncharacterized protein n=1 Tax=Paracoccus onubensis TaxID=1675788 RepID=A0A418T2G5_9RHOB|nr:hypothetical protein [Paracoccus onubensis]RJE87363.1 hypothetical protein D3P04_06420 [Paracoccus onubensis]